MNRDGVKTVIGLLIIGLIIVATFLYGNHQRQVQLQHDQDAKKQQQSTVAQATPKANVSPSTNATSQAGVPSPSANPIQGQGSKASPTPSASPSATAAPVTGGTATTPRTGAGDFAPVALLALIGAGVYYRRSRLAVIEALAK